MSKFLKDVGSAFFVSIGSLLAGITVSVIVCIPLVAAVIVSVIVCIPLVAAWWGVSWLIHQAILYMGWPSDVGLVQGAVAGIAGITMLTYGTYQQQQRLDAWIQARVAEDMKNFEEETDDQTN